MGHNNQQRGQNAKRGQQRAQYNFQERLTHSHKNSGTRRGRGNTAAVRNATGGLPGGPAN